MVSLAKAPCGRNEWGSIIPGCGQAPAMIAVLSEMHILCIHQGHELYGSDRAFIESVAALRRAWPHADVEVVLPRDGPIVAPLREVASRIRFAPIWVLRRSALLRLATIDLLRLPAALWRAARDIAAADIVYVNTVVIIDYLIAARAAPGRVLVHVHEIPDRGARKLFRALLAWSHAELIFNSQATQSAFALPATAVQHVVYNTIGGPPDIRPTDYDGERPLRLLMIGRINRIKGQDLLIEALALLPPPIRRRLDVRIVGGSFANDSRREMALHRQVQDANLGAVVRFEPFQRDPGPLYEWADIVVVPSRRPESLGRVAIEAMAHGRPVIAAAIGGLPEVIDHGVSGWLVVPNSAAQLADAIAESVTAPQAWRSYPGAARARWKEVFSERGILEIQQIVGAAAARRGRWTRRAI
jgi:glycosyltransferase involved in cell wall biosynthesis